MEIENHHFRLLCDKYLKEHLPHFASLYNRNTKHFEIGKLLYENGELYFVPFSFNSETIINFCITNKPKIVTIEDIIFIKKFKLYNGILELQNPKGNVFIDSIYYARENCLYVNTTKDEIDAAYMLTKISDILLN